MAVHGILYIDTQTEGIQMFGHNQTVGALAIDNLHLDALTWNGKSVGKYVVTDGVNVYGVVSSKYTPVSHKSALAQVQEWLPEGKVVNTYAEDGFSRVVFNIELPKVYELGGEEVRTFINLRNSLDGRWELGLIVSPVQVVCHNTFVLSLKRAYIDISARHTKNAVQKFFKEVPLVNQVYQSLEGQLDVAKGLVGKSCTTAQGKEFLTSLIQKKVLSKRAGEAAAALFEKPQFRNEEQRNYWGLFNTVTNVLSRELEDKESIGSYEKILNIGEVFATVAE